MTVWREVSLGGVSASIAGDPTVGETLTATVSEIVTSPTYQWKRDGVNIASATSATYTVKTADIDKDITCVVGGSVNATSNALVGVEGAPSDGPPGFTAENFSQWIAARDAVLAGTGYAKILIVGNSTEWGKGGGGSNPPALTSWPAQLKDLFNTNSIPASLGLAAYGNAIPADTRWTLGTGWAAASSGTAGLGGFSVLGNDAAAGACQFAPGYSCNTADIYYVDNGLGSVSVSTDGGSGTTLSAAGATGVKKSTVSLGSLASNHVISLAGPTGGPFYLLGIDCYDSTAKKVRVSTTGASGSQIDNWDDNGAAYRSIGCIKAYAPDLTIIGTGINDASGGMSAATWKAHVQAIITAAHLSGSVIVKSPIPSNVEGMANGATGIALEQAYTAAGLAMATSDGVGFIDINTLFVDWTTANGHGYMDDNLHGSGTGYALVAQTIFDGLATLL